MILDGGVRLLLAIRLGGDEAIGGGRRDGQVGEGLLGLASGRPGAALDLRAPFTPVGAAPIGAAMAPIGAAIRVQHPVVVFGVLIIILGCNPIATRHRLPGEGEIFFQDLLKIAANADLLVPAVLDRHPTRGCLRPAIATPPPSLEIRPWLHVSHGIRLFDRLRRPEAVAGSLRSPPRSPKTGATQSCFELVWALWPDA